jgi:cell division protein FtsW (lipid II flippase)
LRVAARRNDRFCYYAALGISLMIGFQVLLNVSVTLCLLPTKGLPLPLVSYGGTGLMITSAMPGLVYSVARAWEDQEEPLPLASGEPQAA